LSLTNRQRLLITYLEQEWQLLGSVPAAAQVGAVLGESEKWISEQFRNPEFVQAMRNRGVDTSFTDALPVGVLSELQLACANSLLNLADRKSDKLKLKELGVSVGQFQGWRKDPVFLDYMHRRAEQLFGENMDEAHRAFLDRVSTGDVGALKLYYEMTGRYNPAKGESINVTALIMRMLEVVTKHVQDPVILNAIAEELSALEPTPAAIPIRRPQLTQNIDGITASL